jgi:hypothetical protein
VKTTLTKQLKEAKTSGQSNKVDRIWRCFRKVDFDGHSRKRSKIANFAEMKKEN